MSDTTERAGKHRDNSNRAWGLCDQRDRNREPYPARHLAPLEFGGAA